MKEFEQGVPKNVQETSKPEAAAAAPEAAPAPAAKAPVSPPVAPATAAPVVPPVNAVPPAPQKAQSRALPYVMMVVAFILSSIAQSVINILYNNYVVNTQGYNSFSVNIIPWLQSAVSIFLTLAISFFAGLIAYKRFRKALGFLLIFVGAQSIIELPQALLSLISAFLVGDSSVSFFALFNALHLLFGVLAIILACLMIRYFSRKAE